MSELAQWLCEAGRRRLPRRPPQPPLMEAPPCPRALPYRLALLVLLAVAFLNYYYLDVLLEISTLRALIVFVTTGSFTG